MQQQSDGMMQDRSEGWEMIAPQFMAARSAIGTELVLRWARDHLPPQTTILDVGCGNGLPIAGALIKAGFAVFGIDASPTLVTAFRERFPDAPCLLEAAQDSPMFDRQFDAAMSIGLIFLLSPDDQLQVLTRVAQALHPGGRFLFSAPRHACTWHDNLTGRQCQSLGLEAYRQHLASAGLQLVSCLQDEGENDYFDCIRISD
ncbi:class I SAM-dependent methyltransferase [Oryzifoliimicrobium ureilyticus]|uniref:class I SAM-dependent methyltransferase n=1 Tax=Oryzifoliimicrobium ureilyticus TaxID=3113724 RepID=UPI0030760EEB